MAEFVTEKELLESFEKYRKLVEELEALFRVLPVEPAEKEERPSYVTEANFSYQVHSSA